MSRQPYSNRNDQNRMGSNSTGNSGSNSGSNSNDWQSWGTRDENYRNSDRPAEGERMQYAQNEGYGRNLDTDSNYRSGMTDFERGRKASRDYDSNYTGYRSSNDAGDIGYEREMGNSRRDMSGDPYRHGADYGSVASSRRSQGYGPSEFGTTSSFGPSYGTAHNSSSTGARSYAANPQASSYDGRTQGYRSSEADAQMNSHAGKGPKGWKRTDERIREDVCHMLERDHVVDASEIEVTVNDGVVTLSGHVETRPTKRHAEDIIENISGVRDVRNELSVDQTLFQQAKEFIMGESSTNDKKSAATAKPATPRH